MKTLLLAFGETFGVLFPIVDPIGNTPTFLAITASHTSAQRWRVIARVVPVACGVLIVFAFAGEPILHFFGISLESLQVAGGLVIAWTGFRMITATDEFVTADGGAGSAETTPFSPMAIPLLAGPGAMAALIGLDSRESGQALAIPGIALGVVAVFLLVVVAFGLGDRLAGLLGEGGLTALTLIFGLIVLAIGVEMTLHGIVDHGAVVKLH